MSIDLARHGKAFLVGDVHGDPFAFYRALELTGCAAVPADRFARSAECRSGRAPKTALGKLRWTGGAAAVVFLGDLLDNNRHRVEETGRCAHDGSQFEVLDALLALKREARLSGGDVVWVLGNHDVWNVSPHNHACKRYAPQRQRRRPAPGGLRHVHRRRGVLADPHQARPGMHGPGRRGRPGEGHGQRASREHPRPWRPRRPRERPGARGRLRRRPGRPPREPPKDKRGVPPGGLVRGEPAGPGGGEHMPTWCRPTKVENPAALRAFFGTARVVKAHDVQGRANCNVAGKTRPEREQSMEDGELCRIDVMMSRAFESKGKGRGKKSSRASS